MPPVSIENPSPNPVLARGGLRKLLAAGVSVAAVAAVAAAAGPAVASAHVSGNAASVKTVTVASSVALLREGDSGVAVGEVQRRLHVKQDDAFGAATRRAVVRFQRRGQLRVDGVVGPQTSRALGLRFVAVAPAPAPQATSSSASTDAGAPSSTSTTATTSASSSSGSSGGYAIPSSIVQCESGGNYHAVNSSTGAGGAYQILPSTWSAEGGSGSPQTASPAEQDRIAAKIYAGGAGRGQWSC